MYAELQHRLFNNLASAVSLLLMWRGEVADSNARRVLDEATMRFRLVAEVSRRLHDS